LPEAIHFKPKPLNYPQQRIRYKHYGKTVEIMISRAKEMADPERKQQLVEAIANFMKMAYVTWNKDNVSDETIIKDLKEFSGGELALNESVNLAKVEYRQAAPARSRNQHNNKGRSNNKNNSNNRQRSNNGAKRY
jgi:hypothetical protein